MVLDEFAHRQGGVAPRQCCIASQRFPKEKCCSTGRCEDILPLQDFEGFLEKFLPDVKHVGTSMVEVDLEREILANKSPVLVAWTNPDHYIVVVDILQGKVDICDPEPGGYCGVIPFTQLEKALFYGSSARIWVDSWINLWS